MIIFALAWYATLFLWFGDDWRARTIGAVVFTTLIACVDAAPPIRKTLLCVFAIGLATLRAHQVSSVTFAGDSVLARLERQYEFGWFASVDGDELFLARPVFENRPNVGDTFRCRGDVTARTPLTNPFDVMHWPGTKSPRLRMHEPTCERVTSASTFLRVLASIRTRVKSVLMRSLSRRAQGLGVALVLGDTQAIEDEDRQIVRDSTTAHLIAVSGMHVVLVCGAMVELLRRLLLRTRLAQYRDVRCIAWICGAVLAPFYALFSGASMSAFRGAAMVGVSWFCLACMRKMAPSRALAVSILLCTGFSPRAALDLGFALSVSATAALVHAGSSPEAEGVVAFKSSRMSRAIRVLKAFVRVSVYAQLSTIPLTLWAFQRFSPWGLAANLVITPTLGVLLVPVLNLHALLALFAPQPVVGWSAYGVDVLLRWYLSASSTFAEAWLAPMSFAALVCVFVLCFCVLIARYRAAACTLLLVLAFEEQTRRAPRALEMNFLDVGQGDASMLRFPNGRTMWIDAGPGTRQSNAEVSDALGVHRTRRVDVLVLTHGHPDHFAGAFELLKFADVAEVWWNGGDPKDPLAEVQPRYAELVAMLRKRGARFVDVGSRCRQTTYEGAVALRWVHPCRYDLAETENDNSVVLEIRAGARVALFSGDIESRAEAIVARELSGAVDILKVAHHGSRTSSTARLLGRSTPRLAFVSAGAENQFGHPHSRVVESLSQFGAVWVSAERGGMQRSWELSAISEMPQEATFSRTCATSDVLQTRPR